MIEFQKLNELQPNNFYTASSLPPAETAAWKNPACSCETLVIDGIKTHILPIHTLNPKRSVGDRIAPLHILQLRLNQPDTEGLAVYGDGTSDLLGVNRLIHERNEVTEGNRIGKELIEKLTDQYAGDSSSGSSLRRALEYLTGVFWAAEDELKRRQASSITDVAQKNDVWVVGRMPEKARRGIRRTPSLAARLVGAYLANSSTSRLNLAVSGKGGMTGVLSEDFSIAQAGIYVGVNRTQT